MPLITENGWPQVPASALDKGFIPGSNVVRLETLAGDVTTILKGFAAWLDRNVEDMEYNYNNGERDDWAWSSTNSVWNSNHLSGTAFDYNATQWPMGYYRMPTWMVDKIYEGIRLFEGTVFWGRAWRTPDEMHFQIKGNAAQIAPFAQKLREGYLGLWAEEKPADPDALPLPLGYYYGPLNGPMESVSGAWKGDSEKAKAGLRRWQEAVGMPVSGVWNAETEAMVLRLQDEKGWQDSPFRGRIYVGEWDAVIREGWKAPTGPLPEPFGVFWADTSEHQKDANQRPVLIDETYPHKVYALRCNTSKQVDTVFIENYRRACIMADEGRLEVIIAYAFWRPGHDTWGTMQRAIEEAGGAHRRLVIMADVEDGKGSALGSVFGDQSAGVNDFLEKAIAFLGGDRRRVLGYQNYVANPGLWLTKPADIKMVIPWYNNDISRRPTGFGFFAHQFTDKGQCAPWPFGVDLNYFAGTLSSFVSAFGFELGNDSGSGEGSAETWREIAVAVGVAE